MTIALRRTDSQIGGFSQTVAQAFGIANIAQSSIWVACWYDATAPQPTCSDSNNGAYSAVATPLHDTFNSLLYLTFFRDNVAAGANTVTIDWGAGNSPSDTSILVQEISGTSGFDTNPANGGAIVASPGTGADGVSSGTATPSAQPGLVTAVCINAGGAASPTPAAGTGFTDNGSIWNGGSGDLARLESLRYLSTAALAATFTATTGNGALPHAALAGFFREGVPGNRGFSGPLPRQIYVMP